MQTFVAPGYAKGTNRLPPRVVFPVDSIDQLTARVHLLARQISSQLTEADQLLVLARQLRFDAHQLSLGVGELRDGMRVLHAKLLAQVGETVHLGAEAPELLPGG